MGGELGSRIINFCDRFVILKNHDQHIFTTKISGCWILMNEEKNIKFRSQL